MLISSLLTCFLYFAILASVLLFEKYFFKTLLDGSLPSNLGFLFLSRCLIFKVQSLTLSRGQLKEYIILFSLCQYFFESFLRFFQTFFLSLFLDFFLALSGSSLESSYILSPPSPFVNTFYKLFCNFCTISFPFSTRSRAFLCATPPLPLYIVLPRTFAVFYLYVGHAIYPQQILLYDILIRIN